MAIYQEETAREISFPLGGLGTGCVGLGGNGRLRDWEIFNHPFKNSANGFSHMMVRAEKAGQVLDTRVLQGDWQGGATGGETVNIHRGNGGFGFGYGPYRGSMAGVPHFKDCVFEGEFPYAKLRFAHPAFPGGVALRAFNPFIPMNDRDSSLPAAFFTITFTNTTPETLDYTAFFTLNNPLPYGTTVNHFQACGGCKTIQLSSGALAGDDVLNGSLCIATDAESTSWQEYWLRGLWFDSLTNFWHDVGQGGPLQNRHYPAPAGGKTPYRHDGEEHATLAAHLRLAPGEEKSLRFVLSWHFPNCANTWSPEPDVEKPTFWKTYTASLFEDARACAVYGLQNWQRLDGDTKLFKEALYATSLPPAAIEAVSANLSILKSATCMRLTNGEFYGFEGCGPTEGCCEGSCQHVWNYAYALPFLFPSLERSMRDLDFRYNQGEDGGMTFRLMLPLGRERWEFRRPCVDGQMGVVVQTWRDYLICGDQDWLREKWPYVKKAVEYAWSPQNEDCWDGDKDGVLEGRQHHTLDMELFGPSSWLNGFYLAALKAAANMAGLLGFAAEKEEYTRLYEKGRAWCDQNLFNGEYFIQKLNLADKTILETYGAGMPLEGKDTLDAYWSPEAHEIRYQVANGSAADQVVAQWHANLCGLGDIFDPEKTAAALRSIYKYNFVQKNRDAFNAGRVYALDGEACLRLCAWPPEAKKPRIPITYADEAFNGVEYQAAAHMLQTGLWEEGCAVVQAVRSRFDGKKRNPWNEFECGSNYARSMASYSLVLAVSGFRYNLAKGHLGFAPKGPDAKPGGSFCSFFSVEGAWGSFEQGPGITKLKLLYGQLKLCSLSLPKTEGGPKQALCAAKPAPFAQAEDGTLRFESPLTLSAGETLEIIA